MKKLHIAIALLTLGLLSYYFIARKAPQQITPVLIGTSTNFPPFEHKKNNNQSNHVEGFEIDLLTEIANRINREIEIKDLPFDTILKELQYDNIHVIAAALTETPERSELLLFTPAYIENDPLMLISLNANPIHSIQEFINTDKKVAVLEGRVADLYISKLEDITIVRLTSLEGLFNALQSNKIDALILPAIVTQAVLKDDQQELYNIVEIPNSSNKYAIAVSKSYPHLLAPIAAALENMKRDGTFDLLKQKWQIS